MKKKYLITTFVLMMQLASCSFTAVDQNQDSANEVANEEMSGTDGKVGGTL